MRQMSTREERVWEWVMKEIQRSKRRTAESTDVTGKRAGGRRERVEG